jgi:hypothetical protein
MHPRPTRHLRSATWLFGVLSLSAFGSSCSKSDTSGVDATGGSASQAGRTSDFGALGPVASGGTVSLGGSSTGEPATGGDGGAFGGTVSPDDACAISTDTARPLPSILQLVVDTSGSMDWPPGWAPETPDDSKPPGATKWEITRDALLKAIDSLPEEAALGVTFYPNIEQEGDTCLLDDVALPIQALGSKSSNAREAWRAAAANVDPVGATPTHGAYLFGLQLLTGSPLRGNEFLLLITDGTPTCTIDCACTEDNEPVDSQPLLAEAATALASGVRTFVIGSPGSENTREVLSQLASNGGTAKAKCSDAGPEFCHFDMTTEPDLATGLGRALQQIATSLRSCEYPIPAPPAGEVLDGDRVNVLFTPKNAATETIARDPSATDCGEGWQYSTNGQSIVLCGDACNRVRVDSESTVEVLFGCETVKAPKPK